MSIIRNSGYNLAAALVPTAVSLLAVPLYIHTIGEARYGMLAIIGSLIGYFGVFDFGLSAATAQRIAASDPADLPARRSIFWTAAGVNLGMGLIAAVLLIPAAWAFFGTTRASTPELQAEMVGSIGWMALAMPFMLMSSVLRGALQGAGRFAELNLINVVMGPASQLVPLAVAMFISPKLGWVLPALYAVRLAALCCQAWVIARRITHGWTPTFDRRRVRDLLSFGGWVTVSTLVDPFLNMIDRLLIASSLGMRAVSHYAVPYQLAQRSLIFPGALLDAMLPRIAGATRAEAQALSLRGMRAVTTLMTPLIVAGTVFVHPFLSLWISPDFANAAAFPAQLMLVGCWFNAIGICCFIHLQAIDKPRLIATSHLIEVFPYLACLWAGLHWFGLPGAAAAYALRVAADDVLLAWFGGLQAELGRRIAVGAPALAMAVWLGWQMDSLTTWRAAAGAVLVLAVSAGSLRWVYGERQALRTALKFR
jgi:O-antigen/teichoic acid export membrane protein